MSISHSFTTALRTLTHVNCFYFWGRFSLFVHFKGVAMLQNSSNEAMRGIFTAQIHWIEFQWASEVPVSSRTEHEGSDVTIGDN